MNRSILLAITLNFVASSPFALACDDPRLCPQREGDLHVNESVYAVAGDREGTTATIVAIEPDGNFVIKFDADGAVGNEWTRDNLARREGCVMDDCVGERVYAAAGDRSGTLASIVGVKKNGQFVLQFDSDGAIGASWQAGDFARLRGGANGFNVGDRVYALSGSRQDTIASIVAVQSNGSLVLKFDSDDAIGAGWASSNLTKADGSGNSCGYSVGDHVYVVGGARDGTKAKIIAIQSPGKFMLQFDSDGAIGDSWSADNIARTSGCARGGLCVGQSVYALSGGRQDTTARIVGIQSNGDYVLQFDSDEAIGASWQSSNVACAGR